MPVCLEKQKREFRVIFNFELMFMEEEQLVHGAYIFMIENSIMTGFVHIIFQQTPEMEDLFHVDIVEKHQSKTSNDHTHYSLCVERDLHIRFTSSLLQFVEKAF